MRRTSTFLAAALAASLAFPVLVAAPASAAESTTAASECIVLDGALTWGFKQSFRAYISGTIANGTWTEIAPATYATPEFSWPAATGSYDPSTGVGEINFAGGVEFTGHDGLLDTTIANPTLVLAADGTAQLLLDVEGLTMDDALAGNTDNVQSYAQTPFVSLDVTSAPLTITDDSISGTAVPTAITAEGFTAFGNYEAGTAFDALTFTADLSCAVDDATTAEPSADASDAAPAVDDTSVAPWLAGVVVIGVLVIGVVVLGIVSVRRRRSKGRRGGGDGL